MIRGKKQTLAIAASFIFTWIVVALWFSKRSSPNFDSATTTSNSREVEFQVPDVRPIKPDGEKIDDIPMEGLTRVKRQLTEEEITDIEGPNGAELQSPEDPDMKMTEDLPKVVENDQGLQEESSEDKSMLPIYWYSDGEQSNDQEILNRKAFARYWFSKGRIPRFLDQSHSSRHQKCSAIEGIEDQHLRALAFRIAALITARGNELVMIPRKTNDEIGEDKLDSGEDADLDIILQYRDQGILKGSQDQLSSLLERIIQNDELIANAMKEGLKYQGPEGNGASKIFVLGGSKELIDTIGPDVYAAENDPSSKIDAVVINEKKNEHLATQFRGSDESQRKFDLKNMILIPDSPYEGRIMLEYQLGLDPVSITKNGSAILDRGGNLAKGQEDDITMSGLRLIKEIWDRIYRIEQEAENFKPPIAQL